MPDGLRMRLRPGTGHRAGGRRGRGFPSASAQAEVRRAGWGSGFCRLRLSQQHQITRLSRKRQNPEPQPPAPKPGDVMHPCTCHRRAFLADLCLGFTGLALGAILHRDGYGSEARPWAPPDGKPHFPPRAKSVIWLFMNGGVSHMETFRPQADAHQIRGQDDCRDALQGRSESGQAEAGPGGGRSTTPTASSATRSIPSRSASGNAARAASR